MIFRILDIETVPDFGAWARHDEPAYKMGADPSFKIGVGESAPVSAYRVDPMPPAQACRVVALSYVDVVFDASSDPRYQLLRLYSECRWSTGQAGVPTDDHEEAVLLRTFSAAMSEPDVHLVTWNGRGFDLPVIMLRSLKHRVPCPWYYWDRNTRYRYSPEGHLDLMDFFSDYGATRQATLNDACRLVGLPGKTDTSGDQVADLWRSTRGLPEDQADHVRERVRRYCQQDTLQTALFFLASRVLLGKLVPESFRAAAETFRSSEAVRSTLDVDWDKYLGDVG